MYPTQLHPVGYFCRNCIMMHGTMNVKYMMEGKKFSHERKFECNVTVNFKVEGEGVSWIYLGQNGVQWRAVLNYNEPAGSIKEKILD
jgi:hypothetical protein